jgi:integrase
VQAGAAQAWRAVKQFKRADGRREVFLDKVQRRALLEAASGAVRDLLEAALLIGARPGELVSATRGQLDLRTRTLTLRGKTGERSVPLEGQALALFERLAKSKLPAALLLTQDNGAGWTRMAWSRAVRAAAEAAVMNDTKGEVLKNDKGEPLRLPPGVCLYSCRHTFITQALMDGLTTADAANYTGTSLAMLQAHYSQYVQSSVRERLAAVQML